MTRKIRFNCLLFLLSFLIFSSNLFASDDCTIDSITLDRGERKAFLTCGSDITSDYKLTGLSDSNIKVEYEQYLEMCDIGKDIPGIYLILKAEDNAKAADLSISDGNTGKSLCGNFNIKIADRITIPESSFENLSIPNIPYKILNVKADKSMNLSSACETGISFPEGKWPSLSLLSDEDIEEIPVPQRLEIQKQLKGKPLNQPFCTESSIRALVKVSGEQQFPVKIIIEKVKLSGGEEKEGVAYAKLPPPLWTGSMRDEDAKYIDIDGIRTRYFEKGEGDALLLVHGGQAGGAGNAQSWEQNFYYLSKYFHVYALDRLGQGYTDNPKSEEDYDRHYEQVVEHVYGFIKAVGIKKVHLIGHSQGGWPVTRIAIDHPEIVKSIINIDGAPAPVDPLRRSMPFFIYTIGFLHPSEGPNIESIRRGFDLESYSLNNITDEKVARRYKFVTLPKMIEATKMMTKHGVHPGSPAFLTLQKKALDDIKAGKLKVPTLLVWGYHDAVMNREVGTELFKIIADANVPDSRLIIFDNADHYVFLEYPGLFNRTVKSFCGKYSLKPVE